jgi:hypothetical protein
MRPIPKCVVAVVIVGCFVAVVVVAGEQECDGPYKGRTLTPEELATVLRNHRAWMEAGGAPDDTRRAHLCQANLLGGNLQGVLLPQADLQQALLVGADLQRAELIETNLQGAVLSRANLQGAVYEPHPGTLPNFLTLTDPRNHLEMLVFHTSPAALIALREAFKRGGMRTQERQVTYAIEHGKQLQAWDPSWHNPREEDPRPWLEKLAGKSESLFNYVFFELPSGYGMVPSRALAALGLLILMFSLVYMVALVTARGRAGIWVTWPPDRVYQEEGAKEATRITNTFFFPRWQAQAAGRW